MIRRACSAIFFLALAGAGTATAQEIIHRFDSLVQVARDGTLTVTETIAVRAEGREIKRGIFRDFPLIFRDEEGRRREVTFTLLGVTRDGRPEPHFTRRSSNGIRIYAGEENVLLRRGAYVYTFTYESGRQIRWFDGAAELFWNVTGNEWAFPIARASVRVELPGGARPDKWTAYTGPFGARGTAWRGDIDSNGILAVETTERLERNEGLSIVVALPEGAVEPPSAAQEFGYLLLDYRGWILGALGLTVLLGYYGFAWHAVGRDPKVGTIIPLFYPPEGVSPALANYVHNWGLGRNLWRAFTAAVLSLAVRGLVLFDEKDGDLTLKTSNRGADRLKEPLPPGEQAILGWLTQRGGIATIDKANGAAVASIGKKFRESIETENRNKFFRKNLGYFLAGVALTVAVIIGVIAFGGLRHEDYMILFFIGFASIWLGVFFIPLIMAVFRGLTSGASFHTALIAIAIAAFVFFVGTNVMSAILSVGAEAWPFFIEAILEHPFPFALVSSFAAVNGLFLYLLRAPTDIGRQVMDEIEGLRLYLQTAEAARLNMNGPEITTERFEALLPYAVALDVEKPWAEAFQSALARAQPGAEASYQPAWSSGRSWSGANIVNAVSSSVAAATGAFTSAVPASSSGSSGFSSGGGGSGGGGGGGGGGGW
jgi:uncharacterized membrane protein YgcG